MHFARFWGSGRLENHLKIMLNLFENHIEKELRFDVISFCDSGLILDAQTGPCEPTFCKKMHSKSDSNFNDFLGPSGESSVGGSEPPREPL